MVDIVMERILDFFNSCDEVWIPQAQVEETVREYGFKGPLTVVENGNDMASMVKGGLQEYKLAAKRELVIPEGRLSMLFVGQHIWEKGLDIVVESLRQLGDEIDFCMNFIGTGYAAEEIARRVASYGLSDRVTFHGVISDRKVLSRYYAAADLFLFPSFYDNAPLVIREAASMGTPAILLRGSTASEVVSDGRNGFLVGKSASELAEAVRSLAADRDRIRNVGVSARDTLVRSWENVVEEVIDRYDTLISSRSN